MLRIKKFFGDAVCIGFKIINTRRAPFNAKAKLRKTLIRGIKWQK
jgi:hypothetical protein